MFVFPSSRGYESDCAIEHTSFLIFLQMCGIIGYLTDPKQNIFVAGGINTALTMLQHRGQGLPFFIPFYYRCLWYYNLRWNKDYYCEG